MQLNKYELLDAATRSRSINKEEIILCVKDGDFFTYASNEVCLARVQLPGTYIHDDVCIAVNANALTSVLQGAPDTVEAVLSDKGIEMRSGKFHVALKGAEKPMVTCELKPIGKALSIKTQKLRDYCFDTAHAMGVVDNGNNHDCFFLEFYPEGSMSVFTVDGHRISIRGEQKINGKPIIVKGKPLMSLLKTLKDEEEISVSIPEDDEKFIRLEWDSTVVDFRTQEGTFYKISNFLSAKGETSIRATKEVVSQKISLIEALRGSTAVPMVMTWSDDSLTVFVDGAYGRFTDQIPCIVEGKVPQKGTQLGMNPRYLKQAIDSIANDAFQMDVVSSKSPVLISADGEREIVLPVMLKHFVSADDASRQAS